jgi:hypothetical protein
MVSLHKRADAYRVGTRSGLYPRDAVLKSSHKMRWGHIPLQFLKSFFGEVDGRIGGGRTWLVLWLGYAEAAMWLGRR